MVNEPIPPDPTADRGAMTALLLRLEAAWALARVGWGAHGHALAGPPLAALAAGGPVERSVGALFDHRLQEATSARITTDWPEAIADRVAAVTGMDRYHVLRVVEHSQVLAPRAFPDAIDGFHSDGGSFRARSTLEKPDDLVVRFAALPSRGGEALKTSIGYLRACARFGLDEVGSGLELMKERWPSVTDRYTTNRYCSLSALAHFDGMIFAIAEAVNPINGK